MSLGLGRNTSPRVGPEAKPRAAGIQAITCGHFGSPVRPPGRVEEWAWHYRAPWALGAQSDPFVVNSDCPKRYPEKTLQGLLVA